MNAITAEHAEIQANTVTAAARLARYMLEGGELPRLLGELTVTAGRQIINAIDRLEAEGQPERIASPIRFNRSRVERSGKPWRVVSDTEL